MNGVPVDLEGKVNEAQGIRRNCTGQCLNATIPCRNSGQCIEGYAAYTCDCNNTAFDGFYCHKGEFRLNVADRRRAFLSNPLLLFLKTLEPTLKLARGSGTT